MELMIPFFTLGGGSFRNHKLISTETTYTYAIVMKAWILKNLLARVASARFSRLASYVASYVRAQPPPMLFHAMLA